MMNSGRSAGEAEEAMNQLTLERAQNATWWGRGGYFEEVDEHTYEFAMQAFAQFPNDVVVVYRSLQLWAPSVVPELGRPHTGPSPAEGIGHLGIALEAGERLLAAHPERDRLELHALFFWVTMLRVWPLLDRRPTAAALIEIEKALHAAYDELQFFEGVVQSHQLVSYCFRTVAAARMRAWQYLTGSLSLESLKDKLSNYIDGYDSCVGWAIEPLVRDPTFVDLLAHDLEGRTGTQTHPKPNFVNHKPRIMNEMKTAKDDAELVGRVRLLVWLGIDRDLFFELARQAIEFRLPPAALEVLLGLGFDVNALPKQSTTGSGYTLLHEATAADNIGAVQVLLSHGANPNKLNRPDSRGKRFGKRSALELAKSRRRPGIMAAFEGKTRAPSKKAQALAQALQAAAQAMKVERLVWAGSLYGVQNPQPVRAVEAVLQGAPESPQQVLENAEHLFVFDRYLVACALRDAGYRVDRKVRGSLALNNELLTLSGDLVVDGLLVDNNPTGSVVVAGDVRVGCLVTEADFLVRGSLTASDFIVGSGSGGALMVERGTVRARLLAMRGHTFEHEGARAVKTLVDDDGDDSELTRHFTQACFNRGSFDVRAVRVELKKGRSVLIGARRAKPKSKAKPRPKRSN